jgi:6-phosphogluconolactonase
LPANPEICVFPNLWQNIHLFQVDERCVPPDHSESNYRMLHETLLSAAPIPEANFHRMAAEQADLAQASREYAEQLDRVVRLRQGDFPRLDLIVLGMGADGHTASLFPDTAALEEKVAWVRPNYVEKLKMHRLTMTLPVLNAAAEVVFLISGAEKAEVLRQVLEGPPGNFPAQCIQPVNGRLTWFVDEAAARLLTGATPR